jgi:hypothetical protein
MTEWIKVEDELPNTSMDVKVKWTRQYLDAFQKFESKARYNEKKGEFSVGSLKFYRGNRFKIFEHKKMALIWTDHIEQITHWALDN